MWGPTKKECAMARCTRLHQSFAMPIVAEVTMFVLVTKLLVEP